MPDADRRSRAARTTVRVRIDRATRYDVVLCDSGLDGLVPILDRVAPGGRAVLFTDSRVMGIHGVGLHSAIRRSGREVFVHTVPAGERSKSFREVTRAWNALVREGVDRKTPLIALGGGVVGDLGGFVAATYLRGIPLIQVPTTLLALVDSSVGGKTGVDHPLGKNLVGAFYQPRAVFSSMEVLRTLPAREYTAGLAEVVKSAVLGDSALFETLEDSVEAIQAREPAVLRRVISGSVRVKARVVEKDPKERGVRASLNLGHTLAHAIEQIDGYRGLRHGEAVAVGLAAASRFAQARGWLTERATMRICALLDALGLPTRRADLDVRHVARAMGRDKKAEAARVRFVAPLAIGRTGFRWIPVDELAQELVTAAT